MMNEDVLVGKTVLITGAARRIGKALALTLAKAGADIAIHYSSSHDEAMETADAIEKIGQKAWLFRADLAQPDSIAGIVEAVAKEGQLMALINNASIFEPLSMQETKLEDWRRHIDINLTAPFLLSQAFNRVLPAESKGRIINMLDWRALRPGADHFPYTISKAALAALTRSMAVALAPRITVNGIALGAVLPPSDGGDIDVSDSIPAKRWADLQEIGDTVLFLLQGTEYITGEILHIDGGRHLV